MITRQAIRQSLRLGALALWVGGAGLAHAQYKCTDAKGAVSLQQMPCPQGQKESALDTRHAPAPDAPARPAPSLRSGAATAAPAAAAGGGAKLAPSGRPCKTAAEYAEIKRKMDAMANTPPSNDPTQALARSLFGGKEMQAKLAEEMKACL